MTENRSEKNWIVTMTDTVIVCLFFLFLWLPLSQNLFSWAPQIDLGEKRVLARPPAFSLETIDEFPEEFEKFFNDHFGLRPFLIRGYRFLTSRLLGLSTEKVLIGKEGWLFYSGAVIDDFMGRRINPYDHFDRRQKKLENWTRWFSERGMKYLFIVAPNKVSIYPEFLPDRFRKRRGRSRMDRLKQFLESHSTVQLFDLRPPLRAAKDIGLVYHPNDSHWTDLGAFIAYQEICKEISSASEVVLDMDCGSLDDFTMEEITHEGDLGKMLGLGEIFTCPSLGLSPHTPFVRTRIMDRPEGADWLWHGMLLKENPEKQGTLLMFHDSFTRHGLIDYLGQQFRRSVFVYLRRPDFETVRWMVEREKPDVVLEEMAERFLPLWLKDEDLDPGENPPRDSK